MGLLFEEAPAESGRTYARRLTGRWIRPGWEHAGPRCGKACVWCGRQDADLPSFLATRRRAGTFMMPMRSAGIAAQRCAA
jgi:hypothetical protein